MVTGELPGIDAWRKAGAGVLWAISDGHEGGPRGDPCRLCPRLHGAAAKPFLTSLYDELEEMAKDGRLRPNA